MNLTQALGKLYETLSGQKPKNSQTKIIMDIANGIEDGSISVGGDEHISYCTLHIDNTADATADAFVGIIQSGGSGGMRYQGEALSSNWLITKEAYDVTVVLYDGQAFGKISPSGNDNFTVSGNIKQFTTDVLITGDCTITFTKGSGGGGND